MIEIRHAGMDDTSATKRKYDQIYALHGIRHLDSFYLWLISLLNGLPGKSLLDISCGEGRLVILARRKGLVAGGVDFSFTAIAEAHKQDPQADWITGDGEYLPINSASYDYVTHIGSLEHYQDPIAGMREVARVLKPGGIACILLPNSFGMLGNIKHVFDTGDIFDDGQPLQRYNSLKGWQKMLDSCGLSPFRILKYELTWPRTLTDYFWYFRHPRKMIHLVISPFIPLNLGNCIVYLCHLER